MKHIKRFHKMFEALGVPEGLTDAATELYRMILDHFRNGGPMEINYEEGDTDTYRFPTNEVKFKFQLDTNFTIKDLEIPSINVGVELTEVDAPQLGTKSEISGAAFTPDISDNKQNFKFTYGTENCNISLVFRFPWMDSIELYGGDDSEMIEFWGPKIADALEEHRYEVNSSLGHELMHFYDLAHLKGGVTYRGSAEYGAVSNTRFGIEAVDKFFHYLYFLCGVETIVKASEIASGMKAMDITQEQFKDFLLDSRVYNTLRDCRDWTVSKFEDALMNDMDHVRTRLEESGIDTSDMTDEEVVEKIKELVVTNLINGILSRLMSMIQGGVNPFLALLGISDPSGPSDEVKQEYFDSVRNVLMKDRNNIPKFFANKEKFIKFEAEKMMKKLSGLFAMSREVNVNPLHAKITSKGSSTRNECILNWEAFLDHKGVKPHIDTNFNFDWKKS